MNDKKPFYYNIADNGYIWDKRIVWLALLIIISLFFYIAYQNNFDFRYKFYTKCDDITCPNVMADNQRFWYNPYTKYDYKKDCTEEWCMQDYIHRGEYGLKEPLLVANFDTIAWMLVLVALVLNHLVHNRGKIPHVKIPIKKEWLNKLVKIWKEDDEVDKSKDSSEKRESAELHK